VLGPLNVRICTPRVLASCGLAGRAFLNILRGVSYAMNRGGSRGFRKNFSFFALMNLSESFKIHYFQKSQNGKRHENPKIE
jgi:hypothetical protein